MCQNSHHSCLVLHSWAPLPRANRVGHRGKNKPLINKHPHQSMVMSGSKLAAQTAQDEKQNKMHRWASLLTAIMFIWNPFPQTVMWALGVIEQHLGRPWRFIPRGSSATDIKINRHHRGRCTAAVPHSLTCVLLQPYFLPQQYSGQFIALKHECSRNTVAQLAETCKSSIKMLWIRRITIISHDNVIHLKVQHGVHIEWCEWNNSSNVI